MKPGVACFTLLTAQFQPHGGAIFPLNIFYNFLLWTREDRIVAMSSLQRLLVVWSDSCSFSCELFLHSVFWRRNFLPKNKQLRALELRNRNIRNARLWWFRLDQSSPVIVGRYCVTAVSVAFCNDSIHCCVMTWNHRGTQGEFWVMLWTHGIARRQAYLTPPPSPLIDPRCLFKWSRRPLKCRFPPPA